MQATVTAIKEKMPKKDFICKWKIPTCLMCGVLLLALLSNITCILFNKCNYASNCCESCCPHNWIGYQKKCYYFSEEERDWNSSSKSCTPQATLTTIDNKEEMQFLMRNKGSSDHWIGLKMNKYQTGEWVNGTIFNNWFPVKGDGGCAYLSENGVATARCYNAVRKWICKKNWSI